MSRAKNGSSTKIGVVWQKSDFLAKNQNFGPKKRHSLFNPNHVLATTGKSCSKKKGCLCPKKYQTLKKFWVIFWVKTHLWPKHTFQPNVKTSVIPAHAGSVVILGNFFDGSDGSTKFCWKRSRIKGTYTYDPTQAQKGQKQGQAPKKDP